MKKNTSIWLDPAVQERLRHLSVHYHRPVGDIIAGLLDFSGAWQKYDDPKFRRVFRELLEMSLRNTGRVATRPGEDEGPFVADPIFGEEDPRV